jgi:hypothetical protein
MACNSEMSKREYHSSSKIFRIIVKNPVPASQNSGQLVSAVYGKDFYCDNPMRTPKYAVQAKRRVLMVSWTAVAAGSVL